MSLDFTTPQQLTIPAGATRWWIDATRGPRSVLIQASAWNNETWIATAYAGPNCATFNQQSDFPPPMAMTGITAEAGEAIWFKITATEDTTLTLQATDQ